MIFKKLFSRVKSQGDVFDNISRIDPNDEHRDFRLMEAFVQDAFSEQKKARRWSIFFKALTFIYLFFALIVFVSPFSGKVSGGASKSKSHTAIVKFSGAIAADQKASAAKINAGLRAAFKSEHAKAIVLVMNSPGGSPVQSGYVYDEVLRLKEDNPDKKVYAVIEDLGASGAYYIAAAADEIYANRSSLVGSIGVTASSFGFVDLMGKIGVERRHFTAGEHKAFLDPFSPVKEDEKVFWETVLDSTHEQFIKAVKDGRGERLNITHDISSGLIWNGEQALELGLIDGLGSARFVAREIIGEEDLVDYSFREVPLQAFLKNFGVSVGSGFAKYFSEKSQQLSY